MLHEALSVRYHNTPDPPCLRSLGIQPPLAALGSVDSVTQVTHMYFTLPTPLSQLVRINCDL